MCACGAAARALLTTLRLRVVRESRQGREHRRAGVAVRQRGEGASAERSRELLEGARVILSPMQSSAPANTPAPALNCVHGAQVLVVGAGGIGCELLKNLVLTGFTDLTVIDLDTIDVSNLNRQFLFRKHNVGQSKSEVATEAVLKMNPHCSIKHYCDNVMKPEFGVSFVKQFDVVMNALDNLAARRHMNRLCLAAEKPLIESGTTGYLGQVSVHLPHKTEVVNRAQGVEMGRRWLQLVARKREPDGGHG
eukprot:COSAG02_NODE_7662_length_2907_cov_2.975071_2_plen_250_part_00